MGKDKTEEPDGQGTLNTSTVFVIMGTIADTTWRLFTPVILGIVGGLWLDFANHTKPWYLLAGVIAGSVLAVLLVIQQYKRVNKEDHRA